MVSGQYLQYDYYSVFQKQLFQMECVLLASLLKATRYASHMHECKASMREGVTKVLASVQMFLTI